MSFPPKENPSAETKPKDSGGGGPLAGLRQWLIDTYNGLYVIVLKPRMPEGILYGIGIIGLLVGMLWAYSFASIEFAGGNPNRLNDGSQEQWLRLIAVSASDSQLYSADQAAALARAVPNPRAQIDELLASGTLSQSDADALQNLRDILPADIDATSAPEISDPGIIGQFLSFLLWAIIGSIVMVIIVVVVVLLWRFLIYDNIVAPILSQIRQMTDSDYRREVQEGVEKVRIAKEQREERERMRKEVSSSPLGEPVMQNLAIFSSGRSFDESYEIELESGEFLGQSGAVIAESVDPDPVAIEVWLFDIFDSKTISKTFITPQANADASLRNRVLADMDDPNNLMVASPDAKLMVESPKLQLQASFNSLEINEQGRFSNFKMVVRAWQKSAAGAVSVPPPMPTPTGAPPMSAYDNIQFDPPPPPAPSASSAARPMSDYDDIQFDPPPAPLSGSGQRSLSDYDDIQFDPPPAPPSGGMQPLQPPPLRPQAPQPLQPPPLRGQSDDDDPFGGTGDFTPLGRN